MTDNQKKLLNILREMFQFDQSDLDFGIYRIMRMKRDEISRFVDEELPAQISEGLSELAKLDTAAEIAEIDKEEIIIPHNIIKQFSQDYGFNKEYINTLISDKEILNYFNTILSS